MNYLTASVLLPSRYGAGQELALATIPACANGIKVGPFRDCWVLGGSETNEVVLTRVAVPREAIYFFGEADELNSTISRAFLWFELFVSACYLGVASALVEAVFKAKRGCAVERLSLALEVEGSMAALEDVAYSLIQGDHDVATVAKSLFVRYSVQNSIQRATAHATELLGGTAFLGSLDVPVLFAAAQALAFHPPSRLNIASALDSYLCGESLVIP
jgi:alkylation response protein AidB-like acyl-CoA dehydrogenase